MIVSRRMTTLFVACALAGVFAGPGYGDGTDMLGPILVNQGANIVAGGTGMDTQPGVINVTVPDGAEIVQVFAYWQGQRRAPDPEDDTIVLNGTAVTGSQIGSKIVISNIFISTYRADITSLGLITDGANAITASGLTFGEANDGAAILVIYDDGTQSSLIDVRDGMDWLFASLSAPDDAAIPVLYTYTAFPEDREATLITMHGSVDTGRPNALDITIDGSTTRIDNPFGDNDGAMWDTFTTAVTIPADSTMMTVEPISEFGGGATPASYSFVVSALALPLSFPCTGTVGDYVWNDLNADGLQDAGEPGIPGVLVTLSDGADTMLFAVTDADGFYQFEGICAGDYRVEVIPPADFLPTFTNVGGDDTINSKPNPFDINLADDDSSVSNADFGFRQVPVPCVGFGSIGDTVFEDINGNGEQDEDEPGISGVLVTLIDANGQKVMSFDVTDEDGNYLFENLCGGDYTIEVVESTLPTMRFLQSPGPGSESSPVDVTLEDENDSNLDIDFGYMDVPCESAIGDFVWDDQNQNGIQDAGEPGIQGVLVTLLDDIGAPIDFAITDAAGAYMFASLCASTYQVEVDVTTVPDRFVPTTANVGGDDSVNSKPSPTFVVLATDTTVVTNVDFGFYKLPCEGVVSGTVFDDLNRNGDQDEGEPGLPNVKVTLYDDLDEVVDMMTTDANGDYEFTGVCGGMYDVELDDSTLPEMYILTEGQPNPREIILSDDLDEVEDEDFAAHENTAPGQIGDFVWHDQDGDGIQDDGEPGIEGVTVALRNAANMPVAMTVTDADGLYLFNFLQPGLYTVEVDETTVPNDLELTFPNAGDDPALDSSTNPVQVNLAAKVMQNLDVDFGFKERSCTGSVSGIVWNDLNADGILDSDEPLPEPGIVGVTVELLNDEDQVITSVATNAFGAWAFNGLCAGDYSVQVVESTLPDGFMPTLIGQGGEGDIDSNPTPLAVTLNSDDDDIEDVGFGYTVECGECQGGVTELTLRYLDTTRTGSVNIMVKTRDTQIVFNEIVVPGQTFAFTGNHTDNGTFTGNAIWVMVFENGRLIYRTRLHTSCHREIGPGTIIGQFVVVAGMSRDGGALCPVGTGGGGDGDGDDDPYHEEGFIQRILLAILGFFALIFGGLGG
jgi:hypothetical protein